MKIDRLVSIIMILLDKERIGAQALADMFEVSPHTIYRDIDTINMAGIPVHSTCGVCCLDVKGEEIEGLKMPINKGFPDIEFSRGYFAGCANVGNPLFLLFAGTYQLP